MKKVYIVIAWMQYYPDPDNIQGIYSSRSQAIEKILTMAREGFEFDYVEIVERRVM